MLEIRGVSKRFRARGKGQTTALDNVDVTVPDGDAVGLVGESGSGKSTLLRVLMRLESADEGQVLLDGVDVLTMRGNDLLEFRRSVQMVFQNPMASLSPRRTVLQIIEEGMKVHGLSGDARGRARRVDELLDLVGLDPAMARRYPASFSGGQRQRIAIARALAVEPKTLVCDEAVSALDVSVQAQVLNLLKKMHQDLGVSILFVAHDLAVVQYLCSQVYVLKHGQIVEQGSARTLFSEPQHQYTRELIDAVPPARPDREWLTR